MSKRVNTKLFIEDAKKIHGDKYDYSLVDYIKTKIKVKIICSEHGVFEQTPNNHLQGQGCKKCSDIIIKNKQRKTLNLFIEQSNKIHNYKYDYSLVDYINDKTKVKIICKKHNVFTQLPSHHLKGIGCYKCNGGYQLNTQDFIEKSKEIHGDKYDYSLSCYTKSRNKIEIICKKHGKFEQTADSHVRGVGCPECALTYGGKFSKRKLYIFYDMKYYLYKIGVSSNPIKRLNRITRNIENNLILLKEYEQCGNLEKIIHKKYTKKQQNHPIYTDGKTEWFCLEKKDVSNIEQFVKYHKLSNF